MRRLLYPALACFVLGQATMVVAAEPQAKKPARQKSSFGPGEIPIGSLGYPLGELLLVEGKPGDMGKGATRYLVIKKLNGIALDEPLAIYVDNLTLPKDTTCILYGYETMMMVGNAPAYDQFAKLKGRARGPLGQFGWGVWRSFWVVGVEAPASLEFPEKPEVPPPPTERVP